MFGTTRRQLRARLASLQELLAETSGAHLDHLLESAADVVRVESRLHRALRGCARWRAEAGRQHRTVHLLAEQLLDATSGTNAAARAALGLPAADPWARAVDGLNALTDAGLTAYAAPDGTLRHLSGPEHLVRDRTTDRWELHR